MVDKEVLKYSIFLEEEGDEDRMISMIPIPSLL